MGAIWRFIAGDSRRAPLGIALAIALAAVAPRLDWNPAHVAVEFTAVLIATLAAAAFER